MSKKCYAAIDIGSNAARLLIKREEENENLVSRKLAKVLLLRVPLRLGFDVFALGKLSDERIIKMRRLMKAYRQLMKIYEVTDYRACATSAMRDAKNGKAVINKILRETGIHIEIIDGQEEARMIYNNHVECLEDRTGNFIYVDVGGGSTEINLMVNGELVPNGDLAALTSQLIALLQAPDRLATLSQGAYARAADPQAEATLWANWQAALGID